MAAKAGASGCLILAPVLFCISTCSEPTALDRPQDQLTLEEKIWGLMPVRAEAKFNFVYFDKVPDRQSNCR